MDGTNCGGRGRACWRGSWDVQRCSGPCAGTGQCGGDTGSDADAWWRWRRAAITAARCAATAPCALGQQLVRRECTADQGILHRGGGGPSTAARCARTERRFAGATTTARSPSRPGSGSRSRRQHPQLRPARRRRDGVLGQQRLWSRPRPDQAELRGDSRCRTHLRPAFGRCCTGARATRASHRDPVRRDLHRDLGRQFPCMRPARHRRGRVLGQWPRRQHRRQPGVHRAGRGWRAYLHHQPHRYRGVRGREHLRPGEPTAGEGEPLHRDGQWLQPHLRAQPERQCRVLGGHHLRPDQCAARSLRHGRRCLRLSPTTATWMRTAPWSAPAAMAAANPHRRRAAMPTSAREPPSAARALPAAPCRAGVSTTSTAPRRRPGSTPRWRSASPEVAPSRRPVFLHAGATTAMARPRRRCRHSCARIGRSTWARSTAAAFSTTAVPPAGATAALARPAFPLAAG